MESTHTHTRTYRILNDIDFSVSIEDLYSETGDANGTRVIITFQTKSVETSKA